MIVGDENLMRQALPGADTSGAIPTGRGLPGDAPDAAAPLSPEWARRAGLVPARPGPAARDLRTAALAYVERYDGDLLQLEHEWEFLYAALLAAWRRGDDGVVVRLAGALAYPAGRLPDPAMAEQILHLGIAASRRTQDQGHLAGFLNRLGVLLFMHGHYRRGQQTWRSGLELAQATPGAPDLWEPLATFAHIADMLHDREAARQFVTSRQEARRHDDPTGLAVALFIRGFYARVANDLAAAYTDFTDCLQLLPDPAPGAPPTPYRQLFSMTVQAELARVQGQYARARKYADSALALAQLYGDRQTVFDLLIDQVWFTLRQEQTDDTQALFLRLGELARHSADPHLLARYRRVGSHLRGWLPAGDGGRAPCPLAPPRLTEPLSDREIEVLQLMATGLANREIAGRLVVTPSTVKKHLEHIYSKLDVHSRTAALAQARTLQILP